jgi:hypothetical protein
MQRRITKGVFFLIVGLAVLSRFYCSVKSKKWSSKCIELHIIYIRNNAFCIQDKAEELSAIDSCEYIWEAGVGFAHSPPRSPVLDSNRTELLKLLMTCFSETMYQPPTDIAQNPNKWIA